jgi:Fe-S-cluster-containing hydrogenase component 2
VKDFNLDFNILKASITPEEEGLLVLELKGDQKEYDKGIDFLLKTGVKIQSLSQDVTRNEARCTSCGACITICPTKAFELEPKTRGIIFNNEKCIACGQCIDACPGRIPHMHPKEERIVICDLCDGKPQCVKVCREGEWNVLKMIPRSRQAYELYARQPEEIARDLCAKLYGDKGADGGHLKLQ